MGKEKEENPKSNTSPNEITKEVLFNSTTNVNKAQEMAIKSIIEAMTEEDMAIVVKSIPSHNLAIEVADRLINQASYIDEFKLLAKRGIKK